MFGGFLGGDLCGDSPIPPRAQKDFCNPELLEETGGILFREYCFGEENSLSLTEFWGKLGELCEKNSVSSLLHTNNRLRGAH